MSAARPLEVIVRSAEVLNAVGAARSGLTLQELHDELDIPLGSLHRILTTLGQVDYLRRSPVTKRYFIGRAARALTGAIGSHSARLVKPPAALVDAAGETGETVFLTELIGDAPVCVSIVEAEHALRLFVRIGQEMPLHAAASSRAILAHLDEEVVRTLLEGAELTEYTAGTPHHVDDVMHVLKEVREKGYAVCDNELDPDAWAVSVPIRDGDDRVLSSVTITAPGSRVAEPDVRARMTEAAQRAAERLSAELGNPGPAS
ncbi:IclR family transcriptional regulator [Amycolatopsis acidiphila]|uniref:IclR family transcriptional regulator n=1 Tax=Amycolatopsis acidiphila TaxID=715473 RepID=A0A558ANN2_9PSEU|nr:IclR family transcriptional regulator [Amycolatopsis acidiphila]TVT25873.1 IclR family transcriptional regulator [Amycolatopsis acidiphila]UIJ63432.1 IclR family transcriptional regulator [Amycolatopsis acidiphila]GHG75583.1 IclR family transcriptional regulator [Amycolatopsis acidiphila]